MGVGWAVNPHHSSVVQPELVLSHREVTAYSRADKQPGILCMLMIPDPMPVNNHTQQPHVDVAEDNFALIFQISACVNVVVVVNLNQPVVCDELSLLCQLS